MKKYYIQPQLEVFKPQFECLSQTFSITGGNTMGEEPETPDGYFP